MKHASLFSGIGGFDLAAYWAGIENIFQVEIDDFCQKTLTKNFPNVKKYRDVKTFNPEPYAGCIDILSGGFPCQPFSTSGHQKGTDDERFLWPEMLRCIQVIQPRYVVAENVYGLIGIENGMAFEQVCTDLEAIGYQVQTFIIPAVAVDAPHRRDRVWIIGYNSSLGFQEQERVKRFLLDQEYDFETPNIQGNVEYGPNGSNINDTHLEGDELQGELQAWGGGDRYSNQDSVDTNANGEGWSTGLMQQESGFDIRHFEKEWLQVASEFCRVDDGLSQRLDGHRWRRYVKNRNQRIKALGNAIVPQVALKIFEAILECEKHFLKKILLLFYKKILQKICIKL